MKYLLTVELTFQECCDLDEFLGPHDGTVSQKIRGALAEIIDLHDDSEELRAISAAYERDREATTGENAPAEELE